MSERRRRQDERLAMAVQALGGIAQGILAATQMKSQKQDRQDRRDAEKARLDLETRRVDLSDKGYQLDVQREQRLREQGGQSQDRGPSGNLMAAALSTGYDPDDPGVIQKIDTDLAKMDQSIQQLQDTAAKSDILTGAADAALDQAKELQAKRDRALKAKGVFNMMRRGQRGVDAQDMTGRGLVEQGRGQAAPPPTQQVPDPSKGVVQGGPPAPSGPSSGQPAMVDQSIRDNWLDSYARIQAAAMRGQDLANPELAPAWQSLSNMGVAMPDSVQRSMQGIGPQGR